MNTHIYGPVSNGNMQIISFWPFLYFASFILIGAMIIMNLFIGVIMNSMQESQNELSQELQEIKFQDIKSEELYIHLITKIDELRNEIESLNHRYETPKQALETNSAAELRGIIPSDFVGIVRLTNFSSLTPEI